MCPSCCRGVCVGNIDVLNRPQIGQFRFPSALVATRHTHHGDDHTLRHQLVTPIFIVSGLTIMVSVSAMTKQAREPQLPKVKTRRGPPEPAFLSRLAGVSPPSGRSGYYRPRETKRTMKSHQHSTWCLHHPRDPEGRRAGEVSWTLDAVGLSRRVCR